MLLLLFQSAFRVPADGDLCADLVVMPVLTATATSGRLLVALATMQRVLTGEAEVKPC